MIMTNYLQGSSIHISDEHGTGRVRHHLHQDWTLGTQHSSMDLELYNSMDLELCPLALDGKVRELAGLKQLGLMSGETFKHHGVILIQLFPTILRTINK